MQDPATFNPAERARVFDEARARAVVLRDEAMQAFWRGLGDALASRQLQARRAATRYAQRLERHLRGRGATAGAIGSCADPAP